MPCRYSFIKRGIFVGCLVYPSFVTVPCMLTFREVITVAVGCGNTEIAYTFVSAVIEIDGQVGLRQLLYTVALYDETA